jgi:hypothetical protein
MLDAALGGPSGRVIGWEPSAVRACVATDDEIVAQTTATTMPVRPIAPLLKSAEVSTAC